MHTRRLWTFLRVLCIWLIASPLCFEAIADAAGQWLQTSAPITNCNSLASSADGTKLVAAAGGSSVPQPIFISTNWGKSWDKTGAPIAGWSWVGISADGTRLAALRGNDEAPRGICISTNSGVTWTTQMAETELVAATIAADGHTLLAWEPTNIYASTDFGINWTPVIPRNWTWPGFYSAVLTADGSKWAAFGPGSSTWFDFFSSTNQGTSWDETDGPLTSNSAGPMAGSAGGSVLVIAPAFLGIYTSTNFGVTWDQSDAPGNAWWHGIASSSDGTRMVAVSMTALNINVVGAIYTSTDSGHSWTKEVAPEANWIAVASSCDGRKLVAAARPGGIYTWEDVGPPSLGIAVFNANLVVSWTADPTFILQQSPDLGSGWSDVPTAPIVENGQYKVVVSAPALKGGFFRLRSN